MKNAPYHDLIMDQHWKVLMDALEAGILVVGSEWDLVFANQHVMTICGCQTPDEMVALWTATLKGAVAAGGDAVAGPHG